MNKNSIFTITYAIIVCVFSYAMFSLLLEFGEFVERNGL